MDRFMKMWSEKAELFYLCRGYSPEQEDYKAQLSYDELIEVWKEIQMDYVQLMDGGKMARSLRNSLKIEALRVKYLMLDGCLKCLAFAAPDAHHPEVYAAMKKPMEILARNGIDLELNQSNPERFLQDIQRGHSFLKEIIAEINVLEEESEAPEGNKEAGDSADDWVDTFIVLGEDAGFRLDPAQISVHEYTRRVRRYVNNIKRKVKQSKKGHATT